MTSPFLSKPRFLIGGLLLLLVAAGAGIYFLVLKPRQQQADLPKRGTPRYEKYVEAFQIGVAALEIGEPPNADKREDKKVDAEREAIKERAFQKMTECIETIPNEPAAWANRGLWYVRQTEQSLVAKGAQDLQRASSLAPNSPEIERILGLMAKREGDFPEAVKHYEKALELEPNDLVTLYSLANVIDQENETGSAERRKKLFERGLQIQPFNYKLLHELGVLAAQQKDRATLEQVLTTYKRLAPTWSTSSAESARMALAALEQDAQGPLPGDVLASINQLDNILGAEIGYNQSALAVDREAIMVGQPVEQFLRLDPMVGTPSSPDMEITFQDEPLKAVVPGRWDVLTAVWLQRGEKPALVGANAKEVTRLDKQIPPLPFPGGANAVPPTEAGILALDWNNDFRMDLLLAGADGLRFFQQEEAGFKDITQQTKLTEEILKADYFGAWAADFDMDGDLDIIVAPREGAPFVLRNNGDGTFTAVKSFPGIDGARAFAWADLDHDGAPDAAFVDSQGKLHVFMNERSGQFRRRAVPEESGRSLALAVADVTDDGVFDLLTLRDDGIIQRISDQDKRKSWQLSELARWPNFPPNQQPGSYRVLVSDLDNNGGLDLIASGPRGSRIWLSDEQGKFVPLPTTVPDPVFAAVDLNGDGRLDLLALSNAGQPLLQINHGKKDYHWQVLWPHSVDRRKEKVSGDNRINSFGIGGEVEIRSGLLVQKQPITRPLVHIGLGEQPKAAVTRILWPNGSFQVEFDLPSDAEVAVLQRLKGSCPFLFTYDGHGMQFVSDFMWSTPLGMYINAQDKGGFLQTTDWVKIRGDQLVPRDGYYDVRVTANLWETHYYDFMQLIVVDHPAETEMFVDERFFLTPTVPEVYLTTPPHPVAKAWDEKGKDVTDLVQMIDGRYLDTFEKGRYQGVAQDHWVEVDLGDEAPKEGPVWLVAYGFVHPTDSSINYALEQGTNDLPRGLVLEVPDGHGGWKVGLPALGFPSGKNKTILIRLDGITGPGVARHFRLRTNMEVYWDALSYATNLDAKSSTRQQRLEPDLAELRYRGILQITQENPSSPELPHYDKLVSTRQYWRDLIGYYTRFGDVRELLRQVDDRYVIMNAGDELAFRFKAPEGPPLGWKRDFVWVCDGWAKDGDLNTRFSKTVLPLPAHDIKTYITPPERLEDDPVYKRFPEDWKKYHTRYVTPYEYEKGLRTFRRPKP